MEALQRDIKTVESRYGDDVLHLANCVGLPGEARGNRSVKRYPRLFTTGIFVLVVFTVYVVGVFAHHQEQKRV
jgi:hypothetical protein